MSSLILVKELFQDTFTLFSSGSHEIQAFSETPTSTLQVLASCHSLTFVDDMLVGDPMEKAVVKAMDWTVGKGNYLISLLFFGK